ncbi:gluconate 2-dehydrogenase subunit 3 family protein [Ruegeria sp. 2012CJ41-6]|uniref:Gluconate 2-dehydrogenase subunit 3 family protein n=1 Tax=Ruegeria spongiae TaxID=2942209 RepID=A0ABT0Q504_9RHOB|nr:gluconate 2-dehydrogenase subunit 3 family protein [Ruegeria spongiae]MCL6284951.1 gluconate 2-dehydrogenase subunit 3 family protein [Ruegeria spongiae]
MRRRRFIANILRTAALLGTVPRVVLGQSQEGDRPMSLTDPEAETLSKWCDLLAPGAARAGVARYVDQNISGRFGESMLLLRYLDSGAMLPFYRGGIAGIEQESQHRFAMGFARLDPQQSGEIVAAAARSKTEAWTTPDPNFFYFISRSDAVDMVYGTEAGFAQLDIPYLAHIDPPKPW